MDLTAILRSAFADRRERPERRVDRLQRLAEARYFSAVLDRLTQPILLLVPGSPMRVWYCNAAARRRLAGSSLQICDEQLLAANRADGKAFGRAIRAAQGKPMTGPQRVTLLADEAGRRSITLSVSALEASSDIGMIVPRLLLVELEERRSQESASLRLRREFKLTAREAEITVGLYEAGSVNALARLASRSVHTVRTQLKSAMNKTATRTQAGLVALVGGRLDD